LPDGAATNFSFSGQKMELAMIRLAACIWVFVLALSWPLSAQQSPRPSSTPSDAVLITVILRHDQSKNLDELTKILDENGFWTKIPPDGIEVESWYVAMGLGHIVTLRVPPARLREVNRAIEASAWKAFRSEIYATYDFREVAQSQRERALKK
jgi:hypothetical protein